jgi:hypothetical protein
MQGIMRVAVCVLALGLGACATRGASPRASPAMPPVAETPSLLAIGVTATALQQQGVPYRWGGSDPSGFDCSGLMQYAFAQHGVALPRETAAQYGIGEAVPVQSVQPGDLIFFETVSQGPSHVGMAIGDDRFVHAPSSGGAVRIERLSVAYWSRWIVGARRVHEPVLEAPPNAAPSAAQSPPRVPRPSPFPSADQRSG